MKTFKIKSNFTFSTRFIIVFFLFIIAACNQQQTNEQIVSKSEITITEQEVMDIQQSWSNGIIHIGKVYLENGDYQAAAKDHINNFYNYQEGIVLFKPTLTSVKQFRTDFEGAFSYFVGGDETYPEDKGFAIKPWSSIRWENIGTQIYGNIALAMGNYYFTPAKGGNDVKVEYSFVYKKNENGELKIVLHDSHLPYSPE